MASIIFTISGSALLVLLFTDVLLTVFHPQGHGGPFHRIQNRTLWTLLRRLGRARGTASRPRFLALCGPLIAVISVGTWGLWLIVSFALIYYPQRTSFASTLGADVCWLDTLYFSGYVVSTLGIGDLVPTTPVLRMLTVFEAMSGFALFAVATTYLLAVYQHIAKEQVLALELSSLFENDVDQLWEEWQRGEDQGFAVWCRETARSLLEVVHAHGQYPVLHYFRPADPSRALLPQIGSVLKLLSKVDAGPPPVRMLRLALRRYLVELDHGCLPRKNDAPDLQVESPAAENWRSYSRQLQYLDYSDRREQHSLE